MRTLPLFVILLILTTTLRAQEFEGKWLVQKKDGVVKIFKKGNKYFGKVVKAIPSKGKNGKLLLDEKNPDPTKRNQPIQGLTFLTDFKLKGKELVGGKLYDSRTGKSYKGKIWIENGKLMVRGYLGIFYETRVWTRVK